jgi:hypothetical protein
MALALLCAGPAVATTVTLDSNFDSLTVGAVGGNPGFTAGQGGWGGYHAASISNTYAHSGSQSLKTSPITIPSFGYLGSTINKALDATVSGEYPTAGAFTINNAVDWWVQAWVRINAGGSAFMTLSNGLGSCPLLQILPTGKPEVNGCISSDYGQTTLGAGAFEQWLFVEMVHTTAMGQAMEFRITGPGISRTITLGNYSGPGSGSPAYLGLAGDAYWDDVKAGTGMALAIVPVPAAAWLMGGALILLGGLRRP